MQDQKLIFKERKKWYVFTSLTQTPDSKNFNKNHSRKNKEFKVTVWRCKTCPRQISMTSYYDTGENIFKSDSLEEHKCISTKKSVCVTEIEKEVIDLFRTQKMSPSDILNFMKAKGVDISIDQIYYLKKKNKKIWVGIFVFY